MFYTDKMLIIVVSVILLIIILLFFRRSPWLLVIPVLAFELYKNIFSKSKTDEQQKKETAANTERIKEWKQQLTRTQKVIQKLKEKQKERDHVKKDLTDTPDSERAGNFNDEWSKRHPDGTADPNGSKT